MAKKNKRSVEKRRAVKALKRKRKKAALRSGPTLPVYASVLKDVPFWYAHGANYFASSYEEGTWTPIYDGIYANNHRLDQKQLVSRIVTRFTQADGELDPSGVPIVAWAMMPETGVMTMYHTLVGQLVAGGKSDGEAKEIAKQPHHKEVWAFFHQMREKITKQVQKNKGE